MPAYVCKRLDRTIVGANDNGRFACDVEHLEVTRLGEFRLMAREDPVARNDALELELIDFGIRIETLFQRMARCLRCNQFFDRPRGVIRAYRTHFACRLECH